MSSAIPPKASSRAAARRVGSSTRKQQRYFEQGGFVPANTYTYAPDKLLTGASFGNWELFLKLTSQTDVSGLWSSVDNQIYCGRWMTSIAVDRERAVALETTH